MLRSAILDFAANALAQDIKFKDVLAVVKAALTKKYPNAAKVSWEKRKMKLTVNWGGKSGEDTSVQFTLTGTFAERVDAIAVSQLPVSVVPQVTSHYNSDITREAGKVTDAAGKYFLRPK